MRQLLKQEEMMMEKGKKAVTLYNLIFPIWALVWLPTWLWLLLIPANYCIDRLVFTVFGKKQNPELTNKFFRKHNWKLCLFGFLSDFIGALLLMIPLLIPPTEAIAKNYNQTVFGKFMNALQFNAFSYFPTLLYTLFAIAVAGFLIYLFDRKVILKTGEFTKQQADKIAFFMAVFTAPYLYLLPTRFFL